MPRRRSHGLTVAATAAALGAVLTLAACQAGPTDNGCQVQRQLILAGTTPLPLAPEVRLDRVGSELAVLGSDGSAVRWTVIGSTVQPEQAYALPPETIHASYAMAGAASPGDRVIAGVLVPAANGTDAELRFVAVPADGSPAPAAGDPIVTFPDGVATPPVVAMGTSATGMYAGAAWLDPQSGLPTYVMIDGQGQVVGGEPRVIDDEPAPGYTCLGFAPGKQELTVSYLRAPADSSAGLTWLIADITTDGGVTVLKLNVAQLNGTMSCARAALYDPMVSGGSPEYAIAWQDTSGSWLSIYYGPQLGMMVRSFPFASATDFGGPDTQPPIVGLAAFGNDFGVMFGRSHSVELWRLDRSGNRRPGTLLLPSLQGDVENVSGVTGPGVLSSSYADLTGGGTGRRLVVDAVCY